MHSKDKGYMKLLRMYMKAIKMHIAEGPVFAASEAAGETAVSEYSQTAVAVCSQTAVAVCSDDPNRSTFHCGHDSVTGMRVRSEVSFKTGSGDDSRAGGGID